MNYKVKDIGFPRFRLSNAKIVFFQSICYHICFSAIVDKTDASKLHGHDRSLCYDWNISSHIRIWIRDVLQCHHTVRLDDKFSATQFFFQDQTNSDSHNFR